MPPRPAPVLAPAPRSAEAANRNVIAAVRCLLITRLASRGVADWSRIHPACSPAAMGVSSEDRDGGGFMRGYHDVGGLVLGPIDRSEHDYALWEKRVDA